MSDYFNAYIFANALLISVMGIIYLFYIVVKSGIKATKERDFSGIKRDVIIFFGIPIVLIMAFVYAPFGICLDVYNYWKNKTQTANKEQKQ
jgi:heme/copper-type cytochrome/quinol oxidase subunit 2